MTNSANANEVPNVSDLILELNEYVGSLPVTSLEEIRNELPSKLIRAATLLQQQSLELSNLQANFRVPIISILQKPWEHPNWCDEQGRCWFSNGYSLGLWRYVLPPDVKEEDWDLASHYTHCAPYWAIPRRLPQTTKTEPERYPIDWTVSLTDPKETPRCSFETKN